jgi:thioredoxin 1
MVFNPSFAEIEPSRAEIDTLTGPVLIEFGAPWCGHCQAAQPLITEALADYPDLPHIKIEDGSGRRLGRSFRVKLWPTLVLVRQGDELGRVVRPGNVIEIRSIFDQMKQPKPS